MIVWLLNLPKNHKLYWNIELELKINEVETDSENEALSCISIYKSYWHRKPAVAE